MAKDGLDGLSKMRKGERPEYKPKPHGGEAKPAEGGESTTTITHHGDGSHTVDTGDGAPQHHPDHLHAAAHVAHHMSGGDKHHIVHHDGMSTHSHSIGEDGQHEDHGEGNSADDARAALDKFLGEEAQEPAHQGGQEEESQPEYGGM